MKVQCPNCMEIVEMDQFSTADDGLRFICSECKFRNFLPNLESMELPDGRDNAPQLIEAAKPPMIQPGDTLCPKCGHLQPQSEACHKCGLSFVDFDPSTLPPDPPEAVQLWHKVLEQPNSLQLHENFVTACQNADRVDYATRQYRSQEYNPHMTEMVKKMQERILTITQSQIAPFDLENAYHPSPSSGLKAFLWVAAIASMISGLVWVFFEVNQ